MKINIKTSNGYVQVKSIEIEHLKEELHVYNLNVLGYHTYVVGNELFVVHNECANVDLDEPKELHHIVEQCQQKPNRSGFTKEQVNRHVKYLKKSDHRKVSRLYSSKGKLGVDYAAKLKIDTSGKRIRDWLNGQSFEAQLEFGRKVLKMFNIK